MAPPIGEHVGVGRERLEHRELVGDLGAAEEAEQRALGLAHDAQVLELGASRSPAARARRAATMPAVDACARCAVPNASFT